MSAPRRTAARRLAARDEAARALAEARSLRDAAPRVLELLGSFLEWELGAVWVVDSHAERLRCAEVWSAEDISVTQFAKLCQKSTFAQGVGIPGRAWAEREAIWVSDVAGMARSDRVRGTARIGLHTAFAFPIELEGQVVGVIEFFSTDVRQPNRERLALFASIGNQLAVYIGRTRAQVMARRAAALTRTVLNAAPDCIIAVDAGGAIADCNPATERMFGLSRGELLGASLSDLVAEAVVEPREVALETVARAADGSTFPVGMTVTRIEDIEPYSFTVTLRDLTERTAWQTALNLHGTALNAAASGIAIGDATRPGAPLVYVNPAFERITGYPAEEAIGRSAGFLQGEETDPAAVTAIRESLAHGRECSITLLNYRKDGTTFWNELTVSPVRDASGEITHIVGVQNDITQRREAEERIQHYSRYDDVTGLPNRAMFVEHLELALARAERAGNAIAVLAIDLDNFRLVNDSYGHETGNELLRQTGERLRRVTRSADVAARQSGDEFLVMIADLEPAGGAGEGQMNHRDALQIAQAIAGQIAIALQAPFELDQAELFVGATVGIGMFPHDAGDIEGLLRHARMSVKSARDHATAVEHLPSLHAPTTVMELSIATRLHHAIERGEFLLHFQPVLDLQSGSMVGVEALIRWQDPERGLVPPGEFIPIAERLGLIGPISDWVMDAALARTGEWLRQGIELEMAINLPPVLWQPALTNRLVGTLDMYGIDPASILIEITETAAMHDPDRTQSVLADLHEAGVRLAIDDFGTGYSSLSRLKQMPVTTLKIDRSFVSDLPHDADAAAIVRTIIQLAHNLGIEPLAEGIETLAQRRFLVDHGCALGQGFHFSKPVPADEIPVLYRRLNGRRAA